MAAEIQEVRFLHQQQHHQLTGKDVILASAAALVFGGPLIALMCFCFLATAGLFLVASPLLLLLSPLLLGAGFVFVAAMTGFGVAAFMAIAGLSSLVWLFRSLKSSGPDAGRFADVLIKSFAGEKGKGDEVGGGGDTWAAGYLQHNPTENMPSRG